MYCLEWCLINSRIGDIFIDFFWVFQKLKFMSIMITQLKINVWTEIDDLNELICEMVFEHLNSCVKACRQAHGLHLNDVIFST